jgi:hypothetical protein
MKKLYFISISLVMLTFSCYSQLLKQKPDYKLQMGTMFSSSNGYGSGLSTYISPEIGYSVTSKFRITAGISIINTSLFGMVPYYSWNNETKVDGNFSTAMVYMNGRYKLTERLSLNGAAYKQFNLFSDPAVTPYSSQNNIQGFNMAVDYKAAENFHIQAGFGYSKGYSPFYNDPFGNPYRRSLFEY